MSKRHVVVGLASRCSSNPSISKNRRILINLSHLSEVFETFRSAYQIMRNWRG
jgi:hypothetical protein